MKKFLAITCTAVMLCSALAITGCGKENDDSGIVFDESSGVMYYETKADKTPIKITYSSGNGHEWIRRQAREFLQADAGASYYIELNVDDNATSSMSAKLEGNDGLSDIYYLLASPWQSYASLGQLENLDDLYNTTIPGEEGTVLDKVNDSWKTYGIGTCSNEEHYYIFPCATNVTGIVYNKTMFDEWGWEVPETVSELSALCEKIISDTNGKIKPFVYPGKVSGGYWDFVGTNWWLQASGEAKLDEFMQFADAEVFNHETKSSPSYGKYVMLQTFEDLVVKNRDNYVLARSASYDHYMAQQAFGAGLAAMIPNGNWIANESAEDIDDEIRMMNVPLLDKDFCGNVLNEDVMKENGEYIHYNYTGQPDYICVPSAASNKTGAKAFLAYMCRDDMLKTYTEVSGTPRPFNYDISDCDVSSFAKSCLDVWANSVSWFEKSSSPLWTGLKVTKFNGANPYTTLLTNYPKTTADSWCAAEYSSMLTSWPSLVG